MAFSGGTSGLSIGHASPQTQLKVSAIGFTEAEGDIIHIDILIGTINMQVKCWLAARRAEMEKSWS
jgi:dihydroxyacid dehydratase/phosphogluconate dehydratase